jgi:GMP synthase-like glutamine amidotransferase
MMKTLPMLYLANGPRRISAARLDERFAGWGVSVDIHWAFQGEFPDDISGYSGIFLSGSPHGAYEDIDFIHREHRLIERAARLDIPMLGICFGSQILASALCGRDQVFRRDACEVGYKWLTTTPAAASDPITAGLGDRVRMFVWHNDEVRADHPDMTILAASDLCPNQIWRHRAAPAWGIQGHPEMDRAQAVQWFEDSRERLEADGAVIADLVRDADDALPAKKMLRAFADMCRAPALTA